MDPITPARETELILMSRSDKTLSECDILPLTLLLLNILSATGGLAGNAAVLWLLGFHVRNDISSPSTSSAWPKANFFFLCCQITSPLETLITSCHSHNPIVLNFVPIFAYLSGAFWRRKWQHIPVFWPGQSHGQGSLVGYSPWGRRFAHNRATNTHTHTHTHTHTEELSQCHEPQVLHVCFAPPSGTDATAPNTRRLSRMPCSGPSPCC